MLIEFSISNYRSFREKQTFSMVAASRLKKKENTFTPSVHGEKVPDLLKVAAIYGPNASGKSNLYKALELPKAFSLIEPSTKASALPVSPFRFDPMLKNEPTRFEVHFIYAGQRYEFELAATQDRIVEERLVAYPNGKETPLYERRYSGNHDEYKLGQKLEGSPSLHEVWKQLTSPRVLFITQAVANSSEDLKQLRLPFEWLRKGIASVSKDMESWSKATQEVAQEAPYISANLSSFLREIDVPITQIEFDSVSSASVNDVQRDVASSAREASLSSTTGESRTTLTHKTALGEAKFDYEEESEGTKSLIGFWLPWTLIGANVKGKDEGQIYRTIVVDELDSSLHPKIVETLIKGHLKSKVDGQLVFTTHDTHLMDAKLLRRDQFWITERDMYGATQLRSVHDFEGREGEDIEKRYYEGRYRGLPVLQKD
jgi:AAA15 family ATPase/GTPase